jgi:PilZ domain
MISDRQSFRLRKQLELAWSVPDQKINGEGTIFNISRSGMLFVTDRLFVPEHELIMGFSVKGVPSFPPKGKLVWFRKVGEDQSHYQCGVKFLNDLAANPAWIAWMEENILKLADVGTANILEHFL